MNRAWRFTLAELMVSMALLALVGTIVATALGIFLNSYKTAQKVEKELQRNLAVDGFADSVLARAVPFTWPDREDGDTEKIVFNGEPDEMLLCALRPVRGSGGLIFARVYQDDSRLMADYSFTPLLPWLDMSGQKFRSEVLAENLDRVEFHYAVIDREGDEPPEWYENWEDAGVDDGIPDAVAMTCFFGDGTKVSWLRRASGVSGTSAFYSPASGDGGAGNNSGVNGGGGFPPPGGGF